MSEPVSPWPVRVAGALVVIALAVFAGRLLTWDQVAGVMNDPLSMQPPPPALSTDEVREKARGAGCAEATQLWWRVLEEAGEDAEAYKAIALCSEHAGVERIIDETTRVFEESRVLGMVPAMLDELQVRELVPILNQVETREDKSSRDYLFIGRTLLQMGDLSGGLEAMQQALSLAPDDPDVRIELGYLLIARGAVDQARYSFREGLSQVAPQARVSYPFAFAVAWPGTFLSLSGSLIALALAFVGRQRWEALDALEDATGVSHGLTVRLVAGTVLITALTLSGMFLGRADRTAFGLLTLLSVVGTAWVLLSPLREPSKAALRGGGRLVSAIYRGRIHRALSRLSPQQQVGVLFLTLGALLFLVPLVPEMDLRLMLLTLLGLLMFSTLGTLLLGMLEHAASLRITLRWLAIAGTLPFLLFFLNVERERLVHAGITSEMVDHLLAYALVWGLGVGLALLLSRILSVSILAPLTAIMASVEAVRGGDFSARTGVSRRDEIGGLADAVDHMAEGLAQRERLKQTFRRYVDPRVADRLIAGDASMSEGRLQHATVLFSDVRGFTTMSEGLEPAQVVSLLNDYLALMAPIITRWGGVIDKFIGDAVMAVWEVPRPITEGPLAGIPTERLAVEAAAEMLAALDDFNTQLVARGLPSVAVGVGINSGEVLAGPLGSPDRLEYTVIGDVVNTAQRLEGAARGENTLLVSASVAEMVRPWVELVELEPMALKGKRAPVPLWRVACIREPLVTGITPPATTTGPA